MPFKFPWPFGRPRREHKPGSAPSPSAAPPHATGPLSSSPTAPDAPAPLPPARAALAPLPVPQPPMPAPLAAPSLSDEPASVELGLALLARLPALSTPPTLGRLGGLPAMAQTLPTVERFLQHLPAPPPSPTLPGMGQASEFAVNLPSLAGFTEPGRAEQGPSFPAQLEPPSEPTDVLAPPGGLPGQIASLSGAAAVLEPSQPLSQPFVAAPAAPKASEPASPASLAAAPVQRATNTAPLGALPAALPSAAALSPAAPLAAPGIQGAPAWTPQSAPMTRVLSPEQTLTGNVLPTPTFAPIQRELLRTAGDEWNTPTDFVQAAPQAGERVSPEQRDSIESQRGQGRPLEPETRQRFEQAYGQPLDDVRIHTGATAHATAQSLNAIAFATGADLFFSHNTYEPASPQGLSLIGHELAHVIQQQYGVPGDADELRPPDDRYERQADQLAASALEPSLLQNPLAAVSRPQPAPDVAPVLRGRPPTLPPASTWAPGETLRAAAGTSPLNQPLAGGTGLASKLPDDAPIQRVAAGFAPPAISAAPAAAGNPPLALTATASPRPDLELAPERADDLTQILLNPALMLSNTFGLSQNMSGLGLVGESDQALPVFRSISRGLPGLGGLPQLPHGLPSLDSANLPNTGALSGALSSMPSLGSAAPEMPHLGGVAQGLAGQLPNLPSGLPSLGGPTPPEMPLAEGLGAAGQAAGEAAHGAMAAGKEALGSITGLAPSDGDPPAAPALPSLDKLTEHIWKEVQRKLRVERERSRGLA